jgi:hypothetical protein
MKDKQQIDQEIDKYQDHIMELIADSHSARDAWSKFCAEETDKQMQELFHTILYNYESLKRSATKNRLRKTSLGKELL